MYFFQKISRNFKIDKIKRTLRLGFWVMLSLMMCGMALYIYRTQNYYGYKIITFLRDTLHIRLEKLHVEGRNFTKPDVFMETLGLHQGDFLFQDNLADIRQRLLALPWIKDVTLQRQMPHLLSIHLVEHYPIAHWQHKNRTKLIDDTGDVIDDETVNEKEDLLVVTGLKAPAATPSLMAALRIYPDLKQRVTGAMYISQRRWDIILDNKIRIKLPEENLQDALGFFKSLEETYVLKPESIVHIDMRHGQRAYIRYKTRPATSNKPTKQA